MSLYSDLGVSNTKEDVHQAAAHLHGDWLRNGFATVVPSAEDPAIGSVLHSDGAGSKAVAAWQMVQDDSEQQYRYAHLAIDAAVMNIDDMLCVGCVDNFLLSSTIARHPQKIGPEVISQSIRGYELLADMLQPYGISVRLIGGETEDLPDQVRSLQMNCTAYSTVHRNQAVDNANIAPGQVIVGLRSDGVTSYEQPYLPYNSGIASNGLTLARHTLLDTPSAFGLTQLMPIADDGTAPMTVGDALLSPTRTYAPVVKAMLERHRNQIFGLVHNTGGGLGKCLRFGSQPLHFIKDQMQSPPAIFRLIEQQGVPSREMYQVFNMGYLLEIYCDADVATDLCRMSADFNLQADIIGRVESTDDMKSTVSVTVDAETQHQYQLD